MTQNLISLNKPPWQLIARETLAVIVASLLHPLGMRPSRRRVPRLKDQRTVVLIHGYMVNRSTFFMLEAFLRTFGIKQILSFNYHSSEGTEKGAIALKRYLRKNVPGGRIDLVCHSLGGLVAQVYLHELGGDRRVDRCVTLGTPHRGTYNAYWLTSRTGRELRPNSALLKRLKSSRRKPSNIRFTSIEAESDNIILPRNLAVSKRTIRIQNTGHLGMMFSPKVFKTVANELLKPL